jgi:hypothetical protein
MPQTVTIVGKVSIPLEDGGTTAPIDISASFAFTKKMADDFVFDDAVTAQAVSLGSMASAGAKLLLVKSPIGGCIVIVNGGTGMPIPAGAGYILIVDPTGGSIMSLAVTTTVPATIKVLALA